MRCLIAAILILGIIIGSAVMAWVWWGWTGLGIWFGGGFVLLWLLSKFGPGASQAFFRAMYANRAEPMREATVTLHAIEPAEESDAVAEFLRNFDEWVHDPEMSEGGLDFDVSEYMTHSEIRLDLERYWIDFTVKPPADNPDVQWSPHAITIVPDDDNDRSWSSEILEWRDYDSQSGEFVPTRLKKAFEEIQGEMRLRILVALDPSHRSYRFEYLYSLLFDTRIALPSSKEHPSANRRLTEALIDRIANAENVRSADFHFLPVNDEDMKRLTGLNDIEYLSLDATEITDAALPEVARISCLQQLSLCNTAVSNEGLSVLTALTNLRRLFVRGTRVTKTGVEEFRKQRPEVKVFLKGGHPFVADD